MKYELKYRIPVLVFCCLSLILSHCYSLSNFKTAKPLGKMEDGRPEISTTMGISKTSDTLSLAYLPEFHLRYPIINEKLEMGNKIWILTGPNLGGGGIGGAISVAIDGKYHILKNRNFFMSLDIEVETVFVTAGEITFLISPSFLMTIDVLDWLSITGSPKLMYAFGPGNLFYGGILTLDIGKNWGVMSEFGFFDNYHVPTDSHSPLFYFGLGLRFDSVPVKKKPVEKR